MHIVIITLIITSSSSSSNDNNNNNNNASRFLTFTMASVSWPWNSLAKAYMAQDTK